MNGTPETVRASCLKQFVSRDAFYTMRKVVIIVLSVFIPSCIAYGFTLYKVSVNQEKRIMVLERRQEQIDREINAKLDTLINRKAVYYVR